jgi:hypothetical protein
MPKAAAPAETTDEAKPSELKDEKAASKRTRHKTDPLMIKPGDIIQIIHYAKVVRKEYGFPHHGEHTIHLEDLDGGHPFSATGDDLIKRTNSADQVHETQTITATEAEALLLTLYNVPFTVRFLKQADPKTGVREERTLRGRLIGPAPFGRTQVEDLDQPLKSRFRLVDNREILDLVVHGVKYVIKK